MKPITLLLLLLPILGYAQTDSSNLTIELDKGFFLSDLVKNKEAGSHASIWMMSQLEILDTLDNVIKTETFWHQGPYFYTPKINFKGKKYSKVRVKLHCYTRTPEIDTNVVIGKIRNLKLTLRKEESDSLLKRTTIIEQMQDGDSLLVSFFSSTSGGESMNAEIKIKKSKGQFSMEIQESMNSNIEQHLKKVILSDYDIQLLKAFELDSHRDFGGSCSHTTNSYIFKFRGKQRMLGDSCGTWCGYGLLKNSLFNSQ